MNIEQRSFYKNSLTRTQQSFSMKLTKNYKINIPYSCFPLHLQHFLLGRDEKDTCLEYIKVNPETEYSNQVQAITLQKLAIQNHRKLKYAHTLTVTRMQSVSKG